jgi:hypothetical protein
MVLLTFKTDTVSGGCVNFAILLSLSYGLMLLHDSPPICHFPLHELASMPLGVLVIISTVQSSLGLRKAYLM